MPTVFSHAAVGFIAARGAAEATAPNTRIVIAWMALSALKLNYFGRSRLELRSGIGKQSGAWRWRVRVPLSEPSFGYSRCGRLDRTGATLYFAFAIFYLLFFICYLRRMRAVLSNAPT